MWVFWVVLICFIQIQCLIQTDTRLCLLRLRCVFVALQGLFCSCGEQGLPCGRAGLLAALASLVAHGLQGTQASVAVVHGLWSTGSVVVVLGLRCPEACGIVLDQGSNLCLLQQQADSLPLSHQGGPMFYRLKLHIFFFNVMDFSLSLT